MGEASRALPRFNLARGRAVRAPPAKTYRWSRRRRASARLPPADRQAEAWSRGSWSNRGAPPFRPRNDRRRRPQSAPDGSHIRPDDNAQALSACARRSRQLRRPHRRRLRQRSSLRQLATRSDSREWHRWLAKIWREIELDCVETGGSERDSIAHEGRIVRTNFAKVRLENGASHSKCLELGLHPALEFGSVALAPRVKLLRLFKQRIEGISELALRLGAAFGDRFEFDDFLARAFERLDRRFERAAVLAFEAG